ncbi:hypothetical protein SCAR479_12330 [Seiridium cardinale]|uniref:Extracellular membrane protein CFEM domain-containing protein n=1 Tax=Seiridium cardinale TaxID=138064 RepID=A0ABR2XBJ4_9PEZI
MWPPQYLIHILLTVTLSTLMGTAYGTAATCGSSCLDSLLVKSECSPGNMTCVCTNTALHADMQQCLLSNCTVKDALETQRYISTTCGVQGEDRRDVVLIIGVLFGIVGLLAFGLRCTARLRIGNQSWGLDDWAMCLAVCFMVPLCAVSVPLSEHGLGLDMWYVDFQDIDHVLYFYFWDEIFYVGALAITKIAVLLFYLRVFPQSYFHVFVYILVASNVCYALGFGFVLIFQCKPIDGAWLSWDGEYDAVCLSINDIGWSAAATNIFLDLATILLPLPELFRLSMSWKKKVQILLMFMVGFFVTIVSAIRLSSLIEFGTTRNITQDYVEVGYWSTIEVPLGIVCACMPAIRALYEHIFSGGVGTSRSAHTEFAGAATSSSLRPQQEWLVLQNMPEHQSDADLVSRSKE